MSLSQEYFDWIELLSQKATALREAAESFEYDTGINGDISDRIAEFHDVERYFNEIKQLLESFVRD